LSVGERGASARHRSLKLASSLPARHVPWVLTTKEPTHMVNRFATLAAMWVLVFAAAPLAAADDNPDPFAMPVADIGPPPPDADVAPPPDNGVVPSTEPGIATTPDGRTLTVSAKDETELPVAPLTTAVSSRDWLVGATFMGDVTGSVNGGTLEVGYQIGCGIE